VINIVFNYILASTIKIIQMAKLIYTILFGLLFLSTSVKAQVTIAPTNLFIDSNSRFGTYLVINGSNETQEISVDFLFQYSKTNEFGERTLVSNDTLGAKSHSVAEYIRAFPQNFTLAPNQRQVVRLRVNAPNDLTDGTYWSRIKTTSSPETPPLELQNTETVSASVSIKIEQTTGLYFKKGEVSTGISINEIRHIKENDNLILLADVSRLGNSPFLGSISTKLINSNGVVVREGFVSTTIYFDSVYRQEFDISDIPAGDYTVTIQFESRRSDVSNTDLVQMETVSSSTSINIQ
jgi:hypothetical protein